MVDTGPTSQSPEKSSSTSKRITTKPSSSTRPPSKRSKRSATNSSSRPRNNTRLSLLQPNPSVTCSTLPPTMDVSKSPSSASTINLCSSSPQPSLSSNDNIMQVDPNEDPFSASLAYQDSDPNSIPLSSSQLSISSSLLSFAGQFLSSTPQTSDTPPNTSSTSPPSGPPPNLSSSLSCLNTDHSDTTVSTHSSQLPSLVDLYPGNDSLHNEIIKSLIETREMALNIRLDAQGPWDDPKDRLRALEIKRDTIRDCHQSNQLALRYAMSLNSTVSPSTHHLHPNESTSLHQVTSNSTLSESLKEIYTPTSRSKYTVSITINDNQTIPVTVRSIFLDAIKRKTNPGNVAVVNHQHHHSFRSYIASLKTKEMVNIALEALNNYKYNDIPLKNIATIGTEVTSSYSVRTGRIDWSLIAPLTDGKNIDLPRAKLIIQSENKEWFSSIEDIESVEYWQAKAKEGEEKPYYCLKIYMTIQSFINLLQQPAESTAIERSVEVIRVYEDLPMPQCLNCHWIGHTASNCLFGTSCRFCGLGHLSVNCTLTKNDSRSAQPIDPLKINCHRCKENNQIYELNPNRDPRVPYFPKWKPCPTNHTATLATCPSVLQNRDWLRMYTKIRAANKQPLELYKSPHPPLGPFPWHLRDTLDPDNQWLSHQIFY